MTSNDLIILEAINGLEGKIVAIQQDMNQKFEIVNKRIDDVQTEIRINTVKIEAVHDKVNMGFSLTTIFLGIIGGIALLHPAIKALGQYFENKRKNYATVEQLQELQRLIESSLASR